MDDQERTYRIINAITKQSQSCRKCKHARIAHSNGCICIDGTYEEGMLLRCLCKEFVPSDNLDYIEWLAEKRGL